MGQPYWLADSGILKSLPVFRRNCDFRGRIWWRRRLGTQNIQLLSCNEMHLLKNKNCLETETAGQISSETSSLVLLMRCLTFEIKSLIGVSVLLIVLWLLIEFCLAAVLPDRFWLWVCVCVSVRLHTVRFLLWHSLMRSPVWGDGQSHLSPFT